MNIQQSLRKVSSKLGNVPSFGYAIAYLLCIPIFGVLFTIFSDAFYHSTVQHEDALDKDALKILKSIENRMKEDFRSVYGQTEAYEENWGVTIDDLHVHSLQVNEGNVVFKMDAELFGVNELKGAISGVTVPVTLESGPRLGTAHPDNDEFMFYKKLTIEYPRALPVNLKLIFPQNIPGNGLPRSMQDNVVYLPVDAPLENSMINFQNSLNGFPSKSSGVLGRMMYLSSVTITTLGYGDIVPISGVSRFLVGLESVVGIVLIGLFLNSLAREGSQT